jgi:hypothetical protein
MPRNGSGGYNQPVSNFVAGTTIVSADVNSWFGDLGTEMANSIAKDGQTTPTANLPMGGFRHTNVADATARNHYMALGQAQDGDPDWRGTAGGTANAITLSTAPVTTAYVTGEIHTFKTGASANTGAVTVNVNSLGAKSLVSPQGAALLAGQLPAGSLVTMRYDGTNFMLSALPASALAPAARTGDYTLTTADFGVTQVFTLSAPATLTLPALSGVTPGSAVKVRNAQSSTAWLLLDGNSSETVNGETVYHVFPGESVELIATATGWLALGVSDFEWRRVLRTTASTVAQVDFALPAGFSMYRIEISGMRPATDNVQPLMRTSTDGGSSFDAGAADYTSLGIVVSTGVGGAPANASSGILAGTIDTGVATESSLAAIDFYPGNGTLRPLANVVIAFPSNGTGVMEQQIRSFRRNSATVVNAIRFLMSSGNISEGQFTLFARR